MKTTHKINGYAPDRTDPEWAERVEREAERITDRAEGRWHKAQRRFARAVEKAEAASAALPDPNTHTRAVKRLRGAVEARREELLQVERLMKRSPAGSQHRGKGSHRGVATGESI